MSKIYDLYSKDQRKIDNQAKRIIGYEKMKRDLISENRKLNKEKRKLQQRIYKAINSIDILQEIIYQQSKNKEDDMWLQERLTSIRIVLKGEPNNE